LALFSALGLCSWLDSAFPWVPPHRGGDAETPGGCFLSGSLQDYRTRIFVNLLFSRSPSVGPTLPLFASVGEQHPPPECIAPSKVPPTVKYPPPSTSTPPPFDPLVNVFSIGSGKFPSFPPFPLFLPFPVPRFTLLAAWPVLSFIRRADPVDHFLFFPNESPPPPTPPFSGAVPLALIKSCACPWVTVALHASFTPPG